MLYPLGYVTFPMAGRMLAGISDMAAQTLWLSMDRSEGTGTLDFDSLIMIPTDEGFVSAEIDTTLTGSAATWPIVVRHAADGKAEGVQTDTSYNPTGDCAVDVTGGLPAGANVHVILAATRSASIYTDLVDLEINAYERWLTLRGAP